MKYFLVEEEVAAANYAEEDEMSFLSMRVDPTRLTGLKSFSNSYCQDVSEPNVDERRKYVVVEFRSDKDFIELLEAMRETDLRTFATSDSKLSRFQMESYSKTLVEKNQKDKKCRMSSIGGSSKKDRHPFLANRKEKETLLVYPFPVTASEVFEAVKDLKELKGISGNDIESMDVSDDDECKVDDLEKATSTDEAENNSSTTRGRAHYVTVLSDDYSRLDAPEFFNDTLIDFWMQWYVTNLARKSGRGASVANISLLGCAEVNVSRQSISSRPTSTQPLPKKECRPWSLGRRSGALIYSRRNLFLFLSIRAYIGRSASL